MFDFKILRSGIESVKERHSDLCDKIKTLEGEADSLALGVLNKEDLKAMAARWVDERSAEALPIAGVDLLMQVVPQNFASHMAQMQKFPMLRDSHGQLRPETLEILLCRFMGDQLKSELHRMIDDREAMESEGLPMQRRQVEIERLRSRAKKHREELDALLKDAAAAGVDLN